MNLASAKGSAGSILLLCLVAGGAAAQNTQSQQDGVGIRLRGDGLHLFETDIEDGGEFDVTRLSAGVDLSFELGDDLDMVLDLGFERGMYDFSGGPGDFGMGKPWDDVNSGSLAARFLLHTADDWDVWGGPIVRFSGEDGADFGEGITGGGTVGVTHHLNSDLSLGAGLGVVTRLEDSAAVYPIIVVDWRIDEDLRLRTGGGVGTRGWGGVELIWSFAPEWELGLGGGFESRQFRLNDDGPFPDGVGEERGMPIFARLGYDINPNAELNFLAGLMTGGELRLENSSGNLIQEEDFDSTPFVGINFRLRF
jgi:hypothetical protein